MKIVSMNAYSKDLRVKVLSAIDRGLYLLGGPGPA
jgi:hypothetical protein